MKRINVTYNAIGKVEEISSLDNMPYMVDGENNAVTIKAFFPSEWRTYKVRAYIKNPYYADIVPPEGANLSSETVSGVTYYYTELILKTEHMKKGNLYIGFELFKTVDEETTYIRFEKLQLSVNSHIQVNNSQPNQSEYTVTVSVGTVTMLPPNGTATATNSGTDRDAIIDFSLPRSPVFIPVMSQGGALTWQREVTGQEVPEDYDFTDDFYLKSEVDTALGGKMDKVSGTLGGILVKSSDGNSYNSEVFLPDLARVSQIPTVPTKTSDLTNDSGFITSSALSPYALSADVPTKTSDLTNDSGFLTNDDILDDVIDIDSSIEYDDVHLVYKIRRNASLGITYEVDLLSIDDIATDTHLKPTPTNSNQFVTKGYVDSSIPTVPTKTSDLTNDSGFITSSDVSGKMDKVSPSVTNRTIAILGTDGQVYKAQVSGTDVTIEDVLSISYNIPTNVIVNQAGTYLVFKNSDGTTLFSFEIADIVPTIQTSLENVFTTPEDVNDALADYALEADVPTKTSDLTNDSGFITSSALSPYALSADIVLNYLAKGNIVPFTPSGDYNPATKKYVDDSIPTVPTNVSAFTNDAGYLTSHQDISGKMDKISSPTGNRIVISVSGGNVGESGIGINDIALAVNYLAKNNTTAFTPSGDYNPATKKYVDDLVGDISTALGGIVNGNF